MRLFLRSAHARGNRSPQLVHATRPLKKSLHEGTNASLNFGGEAPGTCPFNPIQTSLHSWDRTKGQKVWSLRLDFFDKRVVYTKGLVPGSCMLQALVVRTCPLVYADLWKATPTAISNSHTIKFRL